MPPIFLCPLKRAKISSFLMILGGLERDRPHEMGLKRNIEENRLIELTDRLQILLKQI